MKRSLLWKLCAIVGLGTVALLYLFSYLNALTQEQMSYVAEAHQQELSAYAEQAEQLYLSNDSEGLKQWLEHIQNHEKTWAAVVKTDINTLAGGELDEYFYQYYGIGRGIQWMLHPWMDQPMMEIDFSEVNVHFLIRLPDRMRPEMFQYMGVTHLALKIVIPLILLTAIAFLLYRHINSPLRQLKDATRSFSEGRFDVRVRERMGNRADEFAGLATTFDLMAERISELITNQRQLISDLSHELRTPLARLDIALDNLKTGKQGEQNSAITRVERESVEIRKLVEDTLTLAWLDNEKPTLQHEHLDLVDLIDVVIEDAQFEFPDRIIETTLPEHAPLPQSNHRALGQALENIIRNAMRYTPAGSAVHVSVESDEKSYQINIADQGPGIPEQHLEKIFQPFYRVDSSRGEDRDNLHSNSHSGFGLGLALAKRQILAVGGEIFAHNHHPRGLVMSIKLPVAA